VEAITFALDDDRDEPSPTIPATTAPDPAATTRSILTPRQWQICERDSPRTHRPDSGNRSRRPPSPSPRLDHTEFLDISASPDDRAVANSYGDVKVHCWKHKTTGREVASVPRGERREVRWRVSSYRARVGLVVAALGYGLTRLRLAASLSTLSGKRCSLT
jgi:hypothetical protein